MCFLLRCKRALSPVVAAIILIAVTVAVSIAVGAWMGALSFTHMQTEELVFIGYTWDNSRPPVWIQVTVKNVGSTALVIDEVQVNNDLSADDGITTPYTLAAGSEVTLNITTAGVYTSGVKYEFNVVTAKGNIFGPYINIAP
ncbi:MAG: hypothetical protein JSV51_06275 [Candidatus Bathyarchaeota archaeon]|nr:MAG: hypothetical protein JSV51_06275 [Candidatus Bathyarchaeota archaeon]